MIPLIKLMIIILISVLEGTYSYDFYLEGYASTNLALSNGVENVLVTDTNRYADGITSAASYDITAPHFPQYYGALANVSDRYLRYTRYMKNAAAQGIAGYGDGDKVREDARIKLLETPNYASIPAPKTTFPVYASIKWNPSDYGIQEGEFYRVEVLGEQIGFGSQFWSDGGIRVNADGYTSYYDAISQCYIALGRCRSYLKRKRRLKTANWMSLVCAIGQFVRNVNAVQPKHEDITSWLPLDESVLQETIFNVGLNVTFRADFSGQLICFANDAHSLYWNNLGKIDVTVTRVSWPPSNEIYYKPLTLPACDSSYAAYNRLSAARGTCNPNGGGTGWKQSDIDKMVFN